jgi:hypothetical protein
VRSRAHLVAVDARQDMYVSFERKESANVSMKRVNDLEMAFHPTTVRRSAIWTR